jgi:DNA-binding MarR family transcriptional regulator
MAFNARLATEVCNCFAIRSAARHVTQFYDQFLAPAGLRSTQYAILAKLEREGPLLIHTLAKALVMDRTTLGRNILPLERDRSIRIEAAPSDRRAKQLHLTGSGAKRLKTARRGWTKAQAHFEAGVGPARAAELRALLGSVVANALEPPRAPANSATPPNATTPGAIAAGKYRHLRT